MNITKYTLQFQYSIPNRTRYVQTWTSSRDTKQEILYKDNRMTVYMPPYHPELHTLYYKIKSAGKNYDSTELEKYRNMHQEIIRKEKWELLKSKALSMQNNHQYFKDNPNRRCLKCNQVVFAGGNNCSQKEKQFEYDNIDDINDPTATAYYVGDRSAVVYQEMFNDLFNLCLATYPRGDTLSYKNGLIGLNSDKE